MHCILSIIVLMSHAGWKEDVIKNRVSRDTHEIGRDVMQEHCSKPAMHHPSNMHSMEEERRNPLTFKFRI
jgi:hypothetical protein